MTDTLTLSEEYNAEIDAKCPGTIKSLKNSNAFMDIRGKWNSSYKLSRLAFYILKKLFNDLKLLQEEGQFMDPYLLLHIL